MPVGSSCFAGRQAGSRESAAMAARESAFLAGRLVDAGKTEASNGARGSAVAADAGNKYHGERLAGSIARCSAPGNACFCLTDRREKRFYREEAVSSRSIAAACRCERPRPVGLMQGDLD